MAGLTREVVGLNTKVMMMMYVKARVKFNKVVLVLR